LSVKINVFSGEYPLLIGPFSDKRTRIVLDSFMLVRTTGNLVLLKKTSYCDINILLI